MPRHADLVLAHLLLSGLRKTSPRPVRSWSPGQLKSARMRSWTWRATPCRCRCGCLGQKGVATAMRGEGRRALDGWIPSDFPLFAPCHQAQQVREQLREIDGRNTIHRRRGEGLSSPRESRADADGRLLEELKLTVRATPPCFLRARWPSAAGGFGGFGLAESELLCCLCHCRPRT